jgi:hypothetical protein
VPTPFDRDLNFDRFNEADVRGEFVDPLLRELGYRAGTENNIARESSLRYGKSFLGRKKPDDPDLVGRADYILEVGSVARWVIETKPPHSRITLDDLEQAHSYALHPNVSAAAFAVTNGRQFGLYSTNYWDYAKPILNFSYEEGRKIWPQIKGLLEPQAFARNIPKLKFDPRLPLSEGYPAEIAVRFGVARPRSASCSLALPAPNMNALANLQSTIARGSCARTPDGKISTKLEFQSFAAFAQDFLARKGVNEVTLVSDDEYISLSPDRPTLFVGELSFAVSPGEQMLDITTWQPTNVVVGMSTYSRIDALGFLRDGMFVGTYALRMYFDVGPGLANVTAEQVGDFELELQL